jgi:hypothetical protein
MISTPLTDGQVSVPYFYDVNASDDDGDPLYFELTSSPEGMLIDDTSGEINWTPTETGIFSVSVQVSGGKGGTDLQDWKFSDGTFEIVFLPDRSILFTEAGQSAEISAVVVDPFEQIIPAELTWGLAQQTWFLW